jgi:hypothetical protein
MRSVLIIPSAATPFKIGQVTQGPSSGTFSGLTAVRATLAQSAAVQKVGFWGGGSVGINMLLGVYNVDGSGNPSALVAQSAVYSSTAGLIELPMTSTPVLPPSDYFLAQQGASGVTGYYDSGGSIPANAGVWNNGQTLSGTSMPPTWPTASSGAFLFSLYAIFIPASLPRTVGPTTIGTGSGVYTPITGSQITLLTSGTAQSISFFSGTAGCHLFAGIYSDIGDLPGNLIASSALFVTTTGLMTIPLTSNPVLAAGKYWLGVQYQQFVESFTGYLNSGVGLGAYSACPWDGVAMAATWPSGTSTGSYQYSIYATLY